MNKQPVDMSADAAGTQTSKTFAVALFLLGATNLLNMLDRKIVGILAEPIKKDLALSDTQTGLLTGLAFSICYAVCAVPIARIADRGNRVRILSIMLGFWSIMTVFCGLAKTFGMLLMARFGVAAGESACSPISYALISDYFEPRYRARAMSVVPLAAAIGTLLAFAVGGYLAQHFDWRMSFLLVGLPGLALGVICWFVLPEPRLKVTPSRQNGPDESLSLRVALGQLLGRPIFVLLVAGASAMMFSLSALLIWSAALLQRSYGWSLSEAGLALGLIFGVGGMGAPVLASIMGDRRLQSDNGAYPYTLALLSAIAAPILLLALFSTSAWFTLVAICCVYLLTSGWPPLVMATFRIFTPSNNMALAVALLGTAINLLGLGLGPFCVGILSDFIVPTLGADSIRYALLPTVAVYLIASLIFYVVAARVRRGLC
ncbi:MFS transporter [Sphingobium sp. BS19]|uniref:spinster family MFS transporter n=1 Tax=Sphingobium sp. BS19 TaxID=3018973 RepID=UPI0022EE5B69|nr:MFS transporter [Sphingobium sp. BS19]GLJ00247.1 MFS transporter [Sphingobium sp. BS19]